MGPPNGDTFRELGPAPRRPTNHCAKIQIFVTIEPKPENGLRLKSQVMADKPVTVRRDRIGQKIGRLCRRDMARLGIALAFVFGLAD